MYNRNQIFYNSFPVEWGCEMILSGRWGANSGVGGLKKHLRFLTSHLGKIKSELVKIL